MQDVAFLLISWIIGGAFFIDCNSIDFSREPLLTPFYSLSPKCFKLQALLDFQTNLDMMFKEDMDTVNVRRPWRLILT